MLVCVALAGAVAPAANAGPALTAASARPAYDCDGPAGVGQRLPVILVHGFISSAKTWQEPTRKSLAKNPAICTTTFDYSSRATSWVDDPLIGPALAKRITALAAASKKRGGPGQVVIVGHSMGGLALRCAASVQCSGVDGVAALLAGAITLGTPNDGTFTKSFGLSYLPNILGLTFGSLCAAGQAATDSEGGVCDLVRAFFTSDAARAFTPRSAQLTALADMPDGVPVYAVAGLINVRTSMYGGPAVTVGNIGDIIVAPGSALSQATTGDNVGGTTTVDCGYIDITSRGLPQVRCSHLSMTNNADFLVPASNAIDSILRKLGRSLPLPGGTITGRIGFKHPTWGLATLVTTKLPNRKGGWMYAVDGFQNVRWRKLVPVATDLIEPHKPSVDKLGHLFVNYNPGRYNGVIILKPTTGGFADFKTIPPPGNYAGRFYGGEAQDVDGDGKLELLVENNDCNPDCAGGRITTQTFGWNGKDYAARAPDVDAACELPDEAAVCRFVRALQSGDLSTLSEAERVIAAGIEGFPNDVWVLDGCDLIGDVTVYCQIQFTSAEPNSERAAAAFSVGPVNGTYDNGAINTAPGEELRYEVNEYIGLGLDPINGK